MPSSWDVPENLGDGWDDVGAGGDGGGGGGGGGGGLAVSGPRDGEDSEDSEEEIMLAAPPPLPGAAKAAKAKPTQKMKLTDYGSAPAPAPVQPAAAKKPAWQSKSVSEAKGASLVSAPAGAAAFPQMGEQAGSSLAGNDLMAAINPVKPPVSFGPLTSHTTTHGPRPTPLDDNGGHIPTFKLAAAPLLRSQSGRRTHAGPPCRMQRVRALRRSRTSSAS